ncbi:threonine/serine exporter family protein [Paenibacillus thailandensis]|uniref:Threonine/serine exporter family protein n=1 Tax=Paenibacillus thailandensis TaxID=393250 RepID=A0ABW5R478_9BACL
MHRNSPSGEVAKLCLLAGKIMLESGGETYRVEDTMIRIAAACGLEHAHSYVTPTGIIFAIDGSEPVTRLVRISERSTDLQKVTDVNDISRKLSQGLLTVEEAHRLLCELEKKEVGYRFRVKLLSAAIASGCFMIMFGGEWSDFLAAFVIGGTALCTVTFFHRFVRAKLFAELLAAIVVGVLSCLTVTAGVGRNLDSIILGSVMPLVPGLLITNAVRDLIAGHFVSGLSKGAEALLTAFAIGSGIAFVLSLYNGTGMIG